MSETPALALPKRLPQIEWLLHEQPEGIPPFALYFMHDANDEEMETVRKLCTKDHGDTLPAGDSELVDNWVKLPPQSKFVGQPLHSIVDYHIELITTKGAEFEWFYFIVSVYPACSVVLLVTLIDDLGECVPDREWVKIESASLSLVNLQIANVNWDEIKEDQENSGWPHPVEPR